MLNNPVPTHGQQTATWAGVTVSVIAIITVLTWVDDPITTLPDHSLSTSGTHMASTSVKAVNREGVPPTTTINNTRATSTQELSPFTAISSLTKILNLTIGPI
jgi:hypothetical protein